jgi:Tfp pilus assembly protein PilX
VRVSMSNHHDQCGMALVIVMALLAVMCVFMVCAAQSVTFVKRELNLIEKKQLERHEKSGSTQKNLAP